MIGIANQQTRQLNLDNKDEEKQAYTTIGKNRKIYKNTHTITQQ